MTAEHVAIQTYACPHCRAVFRTAFQRCPLDGNVLEELVGDPLAGSSFADRYVIEECVGEGGMGRVYRARHQRVSRRFAIKVLFGDHAADAKMRQRLAREAEAASRLSHPNVISVVDFGETEEGLLYLVMDYVDGPTLAEMIEREAPLHRDRVMKIVRDCARGLAHAHSKGLIHRDFKADNVLITEDSGEEVAKIVDFGIAMLNEPSKSRKLTTEGMVLGTPAVMAPEQAVGEKVDHRTDLFSLGVVMYEMMAGVLPFDGSPLEIARHNLASEVPRIRNRVPGLWVDPELEALSVSLMSKRPEDRPQRAKDVLKALSRIEGESSREFRQSEAQLLENDPLTPIPGQVSPDSWVGEDSPTEITPYPRPNEGSVPGYVPHQASAPHASAAAGFTELVSIQRPARKSNAGVIIGIGAAVLLVAVLGVVMASGGEAEKAAANDEPAAAAVDSDAGADEGFVEDFDGGVVNPTGTDASPIETLATADAAPMTPDAAADTESAAEKAKRERAERRRKERERKERERKAQRERERKELERKAKRERERKERERKEAELRAKTEPSMTKFTGRLQRAERLLARLRRVDKKLHDRLKPRFDLASRQVANAARDMNIRRRFYRMLGGVTAKASAALK